MSQVSALARSPASAAAPDTVIIAGIGAGGALYPIEKMEAHRTGALHLAVSVFIFDCDSLLLQQRADDKYHCGGLWANACCSHPAWGESPADCARRRLWEELGFSTRLTACGMLDYAADVTRGLREHERVHVYRGEVSADSVRFGLNSTEVRAVRWVALPELRAEMRAHPEAFAPWFRIYLERWGELGL